jgi:hypothetical protein
MARWIDAFNERPPEERDAILGQSMGSLAARLS